MVLAFFLSETPQNPRAITTLQLRWQGGKLTTKPGLGGFQLHLSRQDQWDCGTEHRKWDFRQGNHCESEYAIHEMLKCLSPLRVFLSGRNFFFNNEENSWADGSNSFRSKVKELTKYFQYERRATQFPIFLWRRGCPRLCLHQNLPVPAVSPAWPTPGQWDTV